MIPQVAIVPDADAEARWRVWQARGSAADRRRATIARFVMTALVLMSAAWLLLELGL